MRIGAAVAALVVALVASACADGAPAPQVGPTVQDAGGASPTAAASPTSPPSWTLVREHGGVTYRLQADAEDCLVLDIVADGVGRTSERRCQRSFWDTTEPCLYLDGTSASARARDHFVARPVSLDDRPPPPCDAETDRVAAFGRLPDNAAYVCVADPVSTPPVRVVDPADDGIYLTLVSPVDRQSSSFPYTASGNVWGRPGFDPPARAMADACQEAGPWQRPAPGFVHYPTLIDVSDRLQDFERHTIVLTTPEGWVFAFGASCCGDDPHPVLEAMPRDSTAASARLEDHTRGEEVRTVAEVGPVPLPEDVVAGLRSRDKCPADADCTDVPVLVIHLKDGLLEGDPEAVELTTRESPPDY